MELNLLVNAPVFRGMEPDEISSAISSVPYRIRKYGAGTLIAHSGELVRSFILVLEGLVKGEMTDFAGRVIKIEDIPAPGALASAFIFGSKNTFPVNVVAITDTRLLIIEKSDFLRFLKSNDKILGNFLDMISSRSQFLSEKIKFLNFKTIRGKLAQYILEAASQGKDEINLNLTQSELAEYFGVARPSIARVMSELEEEGIVITKGRNLKITDRKRLTELTLE
ncbi:MAG TPA: Crp/Fnr family transcriptional regulator [Bacteroidales bacterium]|jgi:CRP-like cAMP-binding protein|nr:Crp/Fnr family transcriptional regulator [Bacteroidales bacterium]